jgi:hypothetical protein
VSILSGLWFYLSPEIHVCLLLLSVGTDKNWNVSAVQSLIELKLDGNFGLGLVSQISVHVLISRYNCFTVCTNLMGTYYYEIDPFRADAPKGYQWKQKRMAACPLQKSILGS